VSQEESEHNEIDGMKKGVERRRRAVKKNQRKQHQRLLI